MFLFLFPPTCMFTVHMFHCLWFFLTKNIYLSWWQKEETRPEKSCWGLSNRNTVNVTIIVWQIHICWWTGLFPYVTERIKSQIVIRVDTPVWWQYKFVPLSSCWRPGRWPEALLRCLRQWVYPYFLLLLSNGAAVVAYNAHAQLSTRLVVKQCLLCARKAQQSEMNSRD